MSGAWRWLKQSFREAFEPALSGAWDGGDGTQQRARETEPDCPICLLLARWHSHSPVEKATHGGGGPGWNWSACYPHFEAVSAFQWLDTTGEFGKRPWERYGPVEEKP